MEDFKSAPERLEDLWRAKVEAAKRRYSDHQSAKTKAAYRSVLKKFADLVLRGNAPEAAPIGMKQKPR